MNLLVWRLLRRNISPAQILGFALASLIGLAIVMAAMQFYRDISAARDADDSFLSRDYLILSRKVSNISTLRGEAESFSPRDIQRLRRQPWVTRVAPFTSADFQVFGEINTGRHAMQTFLFFEAIPDDYLDVRPDQWHFAPGDSVIPIIVSRDYLQLYNFGFAATRGLPQISENLISRVPITIGIMGRGRVASMKARIVGFSSRLNTIAVPQSFIDWANGTFGQSATPPDPSRLIVEVNRPGDPVIQQYLDNQGLETAGDKADSSRASFFLILITSIVITIGAVISILALFILLLSIHLLLQKNRLSLHLLMQLGYTPWQVTPYYYALVGVTSMVVYGVAVGILAIASHLWNTSLSTLNIAPSSMGPTLLVGAGIIVAVTAVNCLGIRRHIVATFRV